jgi:hypothetical protein
MRMVRSPGVASLAGGIGLDSALFSAFQAAILEPCPGGPCVRQIYLGECDAFELFASPSEQDRLLSCVVVLDLVGTDRPFDGQVLSS